MSTDRSAVFDHLSADFNAQSYGGRLEGGYRFGMPNWEITPYAAIQAQSFHTPSYTETDANQVGQSCSGDWARERSANAIAVPKAKACWLSTASTLVSSSAIKGGAPQATS
jgi:hypothetical protein